MEYLSDEKKYLAIRERDPNAESHFVYCVSSTMIFCRPTCSAKLPLKQNILYCDGIQEAIDLGYRPCKRCKPELAAGWNKTRDIIEKSLVQIHTFVKQGKKFKIDELIKGLEVSKWHFCRLFKNYVKMTPRQYFLECKEKGVYDTRFVLPLIETKKNLQKRKRNSFQTSLIKQSPTPTLPSSLTSLSYADSECPSNMLDNLCANDISDLYTFVYEDESSY